MSTDEAPMLPLECIEVAQEVVNTGILDINGNEITRRKTKGKLGFEIP